MPTWAAGDDRIELLDAAGGDRVGGPGRDRLGMPRCQVVEVRLDVGYGCTDESRARTAYSGSMDAWENISVAGGRATVIGTDGPDTIRAFTRTTRVEGRGGPDVLSSSSDRTAKADRVPIVLVGGAGADRLQGGYSNERLAGGPGNDTMLGGPGEDRIVGGPGGTAPSARVAATSASPRFAAPASAEHAHWALSLQETQGPVARGRCARQARWTAPVRSAASATAASRAAAASPSLRVRSGARNRSA